MVLEYLTGAADVSAGRMEQLRRQLDAQLRPVLREREFARFDLPRAIETVHRVAEALARYRQRPGSDRVVK